MSSTPTLTSIPTELRLIIIEILAGKTKKRPRIPCCEEHDPKSEDWGWVRSAGDDAVIPSGVRSVLALMKVNKQVYQEAHSVFFPGVSATFCSGFPMHEYSPTLYGLGGSCITAQMSAAQRDMFSHSFQNFETATFMRNVHGASAYAEDRYRDLQAPISSILCKYDMMESHVLLVDALIKSRSILRVDVCCNFMHAGHVSPSTAIEDILGAFERLDPPVKLDLHVHAVNKYPMDFQLPFRGFPSRDHADYIQRLQSRTRGQHFSYPSRLLDEWNAFRNWLTKASESVMRAHKPNLWMQGPLPLEEDATTFADSKFTDTTVIRDLLPLVQSAYRHHVDARKSDFDECKKKTYVLWMKHCCFLHENVDVRFTPDKWLLEELYDPLWARSDLG